MDLQTYLKGCELFSHFPTEIIDAAKRVGQKLSEVDLAVLYTKLKNIHNECARLDDERTVLEKTMAEEIAQFEKEQCDTLQKEIEDTEKTDAEKIFSNF
jgi:hypothetical protein